MRIAIDGRSGRRRRGSDLAAGGAASEEARPRGKPEALSRREAVARLGLLSAGFLAAGCTPLRLVLEANPEGFEADAGLVDRTLRAFVTAVVPGIPEDAPDLTRAFYDEGLSEMPGHRAYLASDLCRRSARLYGVRRFADLGPEPRTRVIQDGLQADGIIRDLYEGAIFLTQVAVYASIYDDARGCPLLEWDGQFVPPRSLSELSYPDPEGYLASPMTAEGNYA